MSFSIYIHIPFCISKCAYCGFYSKESDFEIREKYVKALINQIKHTKNQGKEVKSVFFGGGTPSLLSAKQFSLIFEAIEEIFDISKSEITVELNPESVENLLNPSIFHKFTRFSMGVQSFDDSSLTLLCRRHNAGQAITAFEKLRKNNAKNINIDIILAIPNENHTEAFQKTLQTAINLSPEHISAYILTPEKTNFFENHKIDEESAADEYLKSCEILQSAGYEHYEISNFAKQDKRCVHNLCYWNQHEYEAFGPSACGFYFTKNPLSDKKEAVRYKNDISIDEYIKSNGIFEKKIEEIMDEKALFREKITLSLRLSDGLDKKMFDELRKNPSNRKLIEKLFLSKLATSNNQGGFSLTDSGFLVSNEILRTFIYD